MIAATLVTIVLWAAGMPSTQWMASWFQRSASTNATASSSPRASLSAGPSTVISPEQLKSDSGVAGTDASLSAKPLPLYLISVAPGRNAFEGSARIGTSLANPQNYAAGATLANGAQLAEIHSDYVLLKSGERSVRLKLHDAAKPASETPRDELLTVGGVPPAEPSNATTREVLTDYLRPSPYYDGEVLRGLRVYPGAKRGVFSQFGLQTGDVITAIDGMAVNDIPTALNMLRELTRGAALTATVEGQHGQRELALDGALIQADLDRVATAQSGALPGM